MEHEQIWAPWRLGYIKGEKVPTASRAQNFLPGADPECFICRAVAEQADRENLVVARGRRTIVILNRYPYNNGHLLIAPQAHKAGPIDLADDEHLDIQHQIVHFIGLLKQTINSEGFNVGLNLGRLAGAGVPGHLHWHVVPRWNGDTNFMPVLAGVDVIPQALDALWLLLRQEPASRG